MCFNKALISILGKFGVCSTYTFPICCLPLFSGHHVCKEEFGLLSSLCAGTPNSQFTIVLRDGNNKNMRTQHREQTTPKCASASETFPSMRNNTSERDSTAADNCFAWLKQGHTQTHVYVLAIAIRVSSRNDCVEPSFATTRQMFQKRVEILVNVCIE